MSTSWPWRTALTNNYCWTTRQLLIGILALVAFHSRTQMCSGVDAAKLSRPKFRRTSIATGSRSRQKVKKLRELSASGGLQRASNRHCTVRPFNFVIFYPHRTTRDKSDPVSARARWQIFGDRLVCREPSPGKLPCFAAPSENLREIDSH